MVVVSRAKHGILLDDRGPLLLVARTIYEEHHPDLGLRGWLFDWRRNMWELVLRTRTEHLAPGYHVEGLPRDYRLDESLRDQLEREAKTRGGAVQVATERPKPPSKRERRRSGSGGSDRQGDDRSNVQYSPYEVSISVELLTYGFGSLAALAMFARNVIGALKDWKDLAIYRSVTVRYGSHEIVVFKGDDLEQVISQLREQVEREARWKR
ncbi:hypothetical protein [Mesorhizobium sp.]|uniref:hypothetical protein n=1 Tax=Mesorhizobium sp. TaxID=1871066 RepID=UPI0011F7CF48|nr:hypothetical protein [Mesorhizobium sp.]TIL42771.1 MAG: hypothetical protein E5Y86_25520 [Mesorhizobium sp.]